MPISEALALEPGLVVHGVDHDADVHALGLLARWAERYGPTVGLEEASCPQSVFVEVTGCGAYFGGEERLLDRAVHELPKAGWFVRLALADTIGAAWALAHYSVTTPTLALPGETEGALGPLPVAALRLPDPLAKLFAQLGVFHVRELLALPRPDLSGRFGVEVLTRLDQALGRQPEVLVPHRPLPDVEAGRCFEFATDRRAILEMTLDELTEQIHATLLQRNLGIRQIEGWFYHPSAPPVRFEVSTFNAHRTTHDLRQLLKVRLEQVPFAEPVCAVRLRVTATEPLRDHQGEFFDDRVVGPDSLGQLIDSLSNRLGRCAVVRATLLPDAQPECACRFDPLIQAPQAAGGPKSRASKKPAANEPSPFASCAARPIQLWPTPVPIEVIALVPDGPPAWFRWDGGEHRIVGAWGPERIATGWWRGPDVQRDYYAVATSRGTHFWLFRDRRTRRWFLHGCFD
jgi:protein ImuB